MVFEYAEYDLNGLLEYHNQDARRKAEDHTFATQVSLKEAHVKSYMKQLCDGAWRGVCGAVLCCASACVRFVHALDHPPI